MTRDYNDQCHRSWAIIRVGRLCSWSLLIRLRPGYTLLCLPAPPLCTLSGNAPSKYSFSCTFTILQHSIDASALTKGLPAILAKLFDTSWQQSQSVLEVDLM